MLSNFRMRIELENWRNRGCLDLDDQYELLVEAWLFDLPSNILHSTCSADLALCTALPSIMRTDFEEGTSKRCASIAV